MVDLTPEQEASLATFIEITNWQGEQEGAVRLLQSTNWNVETAVMLHFDGGVEQQQQPPPQREAAPEQQPQSGNSNNNSIPTSLMEELHSAEPIHDEAPRVPNDSSPTIYRPQGTTGIGGGFSIINTVLFSPVVWGYKMINTVLYFLSWLFPFFPRLTGYYPANRNATRAETTRENSWSSGEAAAARFVQKFEETYNTGQSDHLPPFFKGGYTQALEHAKTNLKYLVVILLSDEHELTPKFSRDVLLSEQVLGLLNRSDVVLWTGNVKESEAYQVANGLQATKFPFASLIAPSPKTPTSNVLVMSVLTRLKAMTDPAAFVSALEEKMEAHQPKLMSLVLDKQEREMSRRLREEQDSAYERSLAADRERERQAREEREAQERAEQDRKQKEQEREERERLMALWKRWRARQLRAKFDSLNNDADKKTAKISLRFSTGERVIQKFDPDSPVEEVYAFVECYDALQQIINNNDESEYDDVDQPEGYVHKYNSFELVSPMPRKVLSADTTMTIKEEPTLWPNGSLVVELTDDEESDEEAD